MKQLLFHVSDKKYDILRPILPEDYLYFSMNCFLSFFGNWIYIFDFQALSKNFDIQKYPSSCIEQKCSGRRGQKYSFRSQNLETEYRIYRHPIIVNKYALGIVKHFNESKGVLRTILRNEIIKEESVNFGKKDEKEIR